MATANQQYAYNYFVNAGWSPNAANAMVATLSGESSPDLHTATLQGPDAAHGGGNGIAAWSATRWIQVGQPQGLDAQLAAVNLEARQMGVDVSSNADPASQTYDLTKNYENPATNNASQRWADYSNSGVADGSGASSNGMSLSYMDPTEGAAQGSADSVASAGASGFLNTPLTQMGLGALGLGGVAAQGSKLVSSLASGVGLGGGTNPIGQNTGTGTPIVITDATSVGSKGASDLGKNISSTGQAADQTITQNTSALSKTLTGLWQYAGNIGFDFIPRIGVGTAAIVLLLMGIWLMGKQGEKA